METRLQYTKRIKQELKREYSEASAYDIKDIATGSYHTQEWNTYAVQWMCDNIPNGTQANVLKRELGRDFIMRRVFHDNPGLAERYLAAGCYAFCAEPNQALAKLTPEEREALELD